MRTEDEKRTFETRRAEHLELLRDHGIGLDAAEALLSSWEREAVGRGVDRDSAAFWERADAWIAVRRWR